MMIERKIRTEKVGFLILEDEVVEWELIVRIAILKAVAGKLIPGIPIQTRISILQQTASDGSDPAADTANAANAFKGLDISSSNQLSVLEEVIDRATSRNEIQTEIDGMVTCQVCCVLLTVIVVLSKAIENHKSNLAPLRAFRQVHHDRLKKELFEKDKDARLRSGTRGMAARKALIAFEKLVAESSGRWGCSNL